MALRWPLWGMRWASGESFSGESCSAPSFVADFEPSQSRRKNLRATTVPLDKNWDMSEGSCLAKMLVSPISFELLTARASAERGVRRQSRKAMIELRERIKRY